MIDVYSVKQAARIFDLTESRLRYWAQTGFVNPSVRKGGRMFYTFGDLINLRAAKDLLEAGLSMQKARKNLAALRALLPDIAHPASAMRILSDGETVARADEVVFDPLSGQVIMDFTVDALSSQIAEVMALPTSETGTERPAREPAQQAGPESLEDPGSQPAAKGENHEDGAAAKPMSAAPLIAIEDEPTEAYKPSGPYGWFMAGCDAEDRSDLSAAEEAYRKALELQPTLAAAHTNLGNLLYRRGDAIAARAAYERAIELEPNQPEARFNLGNVLEDIGETDLAIAEMRRVCWAHPEFADAHYNLGLLLARSGGVTQARKHLEMYLELDEESDWSQHARTFLTALG